MNSKSHSDDHNHGHSHQHCGGTVALCEEQGSSVAAKSPRKSSCCSTSDPVQNESFQEAVSSSLCGGVAEHSSTFKAELPVTKQVQGAGGTVIHIAQMDCPTEEGLLRKKLGSMGAVTALDFNLIQRVQTVTHAS